MEDINEIALIRALIIYMKFLTITTNKFQN